MAKSTRYPIGPVEPEPRFEARPPSESLWEAIGLMVGQAGMLESVLRASFVRLIGTERVRLVAEGQPSKWLIDNLRVLIDHHLDAASEDSQEMLQGLKEAEDGFRRRNDLVHVGLGSDELGYLRRSSKHHKLPTFHDVTIGEIDQVRRDLMVAGAKADLGRAGVCLRQPGVEGARSGCR